MNVAELIKKLQGLDANKEVYMANYEGRTGPLHVCTVEDDLTVHGDGCVCLCPFEEDDEDTDDDEED